MTYILMRILFPTDFQFHHNDHPQIHSHKIRPDAQTVVGIERSHGSVSFYKIAVPFERTGGIQTDKVGNVIAVKSSAPVDESLICEIFAVHEYVVGRNRSVD